MCLISEVALTVFLTAMISPTGISLLATRCRPLSTFLEHEKLGNMQYASHQPDDIDTIGEGRVAGISGRQLRNLDHFWLKVPGEVIVLGGRFNIVDNFFEFLELFFFRFIICQPCNFLKIVQDSSYLLNPGTFFLTWIVSGSDSVC